MKLKDNFFLIKNFFPTETGFDFIIELNPEHYIYQAHFPENPITPGVCIIQIIKELLIEILPYKIFLKKIDNVKFLNVINPLKNREITFSISLSSEEKDKHKINAVVFNNAHRFAKLSMLFTNQ
jgi:3-hydroxyacyl-[acyl-carrier-protein] dehydratase